MRCLVYYLGLVNGAAMMLARRGSRTPHLWLGSGRLGATRFLRKELEVKNSLHFCLTRDGIKALTRQTRLGTSGGVFDQTSHSLLSSELPKAPSFSPLPAPVTFSPTIVSNGCSNRHSRMPPRLWIFRTSVSSSCKYHNCS